MSLESFFMLIFATYKKEKDEKDTDNDDARPRHDGMG
jgi:hypothetical protein